MPDVATPPPERAIEAPPRSAWPHSLRANLPIPILLLLIIPLAARVEDRHAFSPYYARIVTLIGYNLILAVSLQLINGFSGQFSLGHAGFMAVGAYLAAYPAKAYADAHNHLADPGLTLLFFLALGLTTAVTGAALALLFYLLRRSRRLANWLPPVLMLALVIWMLVDLSAAARTTGPAPHLVWSRAIDLIARVYTATSEQLTPAAKQLTTALPLAARPPLTFIVLLLGGGMCAAVAGFIVGLPALRLRGDYLAIATLGMAEIIRILIQNAQPLGAALGLTGIPRYTNLAWLYGAALITIVVVWRIAYSAKGRAIAAVREDEIAAGAIGIDPTKQKVIAFVVGAFFAGLAGALFSLNEFSITPTRFGLDRSIEVVVMVTLGGLGSISGAILAAIVLTILPEVLRPIADLRMVIYSALLVGMMLLRPQGLLGGRELWPRRFSARRPHPRDAAPHPDTPPTPITLCVENASRTFGGLKAVSNFSIQVAGGELVGLIGPNGAGKTTAFNLITGVYKPTAGQILLGGKRIDGHSPVQINHAGIARTFQNIRLFGALSVLDNVTVAFPRPAMYSLWRTVLRTPRFARARAQADLDGLDLLATMGLADKADLLARNLPYGDQRRLEIARALATNPKVLLLDEPAAGMNPQEKLELMRLIRFIRDHFGVGILLIEHDMHLVMNVCQRLTVLDHGETIAVGTPVEVQNDPKVIEAYLGEPG